MEEMLVVLLLPLLLLLVLLLQEYHHRVHPNLHLHVVLLLVLDHQHRLQIQDHHLYQDLFLLGVMTIIVMKIAMDMIVVVEVAWKQKDDGNFIQLMSYHPHLHSKEYRKFIQVVTDLVDQSFHPQDLLCQYHHQYKEPLLQLQEFLHHQGLDRHQVHLLLLVLLLHQEHDPLDYLHQQDPQVLQQHHAHLRFHLQVLDPHLPDHLDLHHLDLHHPVLHQEEDLHHLLEVLDRRQAHHQGDDRRQAHLVDLGPHLLLDLRLNIS
jgi:hypothetical protein